MDDTGRRLARIEAAALAHRFVLQTLLIVIAEHMPDRVGFAAKIADATARRGDVEPGAGGLSAERLLEFRALIDREIEETFSGVLAALKLSPREGR